MLFNLLGKVLFPRRQEWEQSRKAKVLVAAVCIGLIVAAVMAFIFYLRGGIGK